MNSKVEELYNKIIDNSKKEKNVSLEELAEKGYDIISTNPIRIRKYDI